MRYITRLETQEECWHVLAAICRSLAGSGSRLSCTAGKSSFNATRSSSVIGRGETIAQPQSVGDISVSTQDQRSASVDDQSQHSPLISETQYNRANHQLTQHAEGLVRRCLPHMAHAVLSENLVQYVSVMQEHVPSLSSELQGALDALVDHTLRSDLSHHCNPDASNGCETPQPVREEQPQAGEGHSLTPQDTSQSSTLFTANSTVGRLAQYLLPSVNNAAVDNGDNGVASADGGGKGIASGVAQPALSDTQSAGSASGFADDDASAMRPRPVGAAEIKIALEVFSRRPMTTVQQLDEMRSIIVQYQRHPDKRVRQQCCVSVIEALSNWMHHARSNQTLVYSNRVIEILELYLKLAVMELDPKVRLVEVTLLADAVELRSFLREQRILRTLISFLHDISHVREKTMELLVTLAQDTHHGSSADAVHHSLLIVVESCVAALEYSSDPRILIRHMSDLQTVAKFSLRPLMGHLGRTFVACRRRLVEEVVPDAIALSTLKTLQAILEAIKREEAVLLRYKDVAQELYAPVTLVLRASTAASLGHAAIGVLVCMHEIGASPPDWDARMLHELLQSITAVYIEGTNSTEEELGRALTLFGQIGAVDPATKPDIATMKKKDDEAAIRDEADLELTYDYTKIVYRDLSRMLDLSLSETVCVQAMRALLQLVQTTSDRKELIGGSHAVKAILQIARRANDAPSLRIEALHILAAITSLRHEKVCKTLLPELVILFEQLWYPQDHALFRAVLDLVSALKPGNLSGKEQSEVWPWLYPRLVDVALQDHTESREFCLRVVGIILHARFIPPHCIPIVFPMLTQFVQQMDQLVELRSLSLCVAVHIVCNLKAVQHLPSLMHTIRTLTRHCDLSEDLGPRLSTPMVHAFLKILVNMHPGGRAVLQALRERLGDVDGGNTAGKGVNVVLGDGDTRPSAALNPVGAAGSCEKFHPRSCVERYDQQQKQRQQGRHYLDPNDEEAYDSLPHDQQDITLFMKHVEFGLRTKDIKWREWFSEFQKNMIVVSPHPVFRIMVDLFDKHEPLRRKLFHPSFKCFYESLNAEHMKKVKDVLNLALRSSDSEVVSKCIGLADYLDHNPLNIGEPVLQQLRSLEGNDTMDRENHSNTQASNLGASSISTLPVSRQDNDRYDYSDQVHLYRSGSDGANFESALHSCSSQRDRDIGHKNKFLSQTHKIPNDAKESDKGSDSKVELDDDSKVMDEGRETEKGNAARECASRQPTLPRSLSVDDDIHAGFSSLAAPIARCITASSHHAARVTMCGDASDPTAELGLHSRATAIPSTVNPLFTNESLVEAALRTRMFDKAMSYLENKLLPVMEKYRYSHSVPKELVHAVVLPLASLYSRREMQDSVVGLFRAMRYESDNEDGFAYELLQWWDVAQGVYANKVQGCGKSSLVDVEGYVRTLCLCGEWERALQVVKDTYKYLEQPSSTIAQSGATAAWILGEWDDVRMLAERLPTKEKGNAAIRLFFQNAALFYQEFGNRAQWEGKSRNLDRCTNASSRIEVLHNSILRAKMEVDESLKTLLPLSYAHAYENLTLLQHFTEMEEHIAYVHSQTDEFRAQLLERWNRRFASLKRDSLMPSLRSLMLHSLVLNPKEMSSMVVNFCERTGANYPQLSKWAMSWLKRGEFYRGSHPGHSDHAVTKAPLSLEPSVAVTYIAQVWGDGQRQQAVQLMENFLKEARSTMEENQPQTYGFAQLRLGTWKQEMFADSFWKVEHRHEVLRHFHEAVRAVPESWEAWHSWGLMNYRVQQRDHTLTEYEQRLFVEAAHQGFVAAICRSASSSTALPGVMRLLQLWVFHNGMSLLKESVADSVSRIPTDYWVQAIPQLIGHLRNTSRDVRDVISMILYRLCFVHSQAVVFPLLVVLMSDDGGGGATHSRRRELAQSIINHLPKRIRADAELVATLLINASATPIERICESLSAVATAWNPNAEYEEDKEEVKRKLKYVLDIFNANHRHLLFTVGDIGQYVRIVMEDDRLGHREKASGVVSQLVDEITKHISEKLGKEPQKAMEPLLNLRNLSIAVFGEYDIRYTNFPTIASFSSKLDVIPSKKRPRRIRLSGSNGCMYTYCLKGNEDIRMDERVMQLFGMVNVLLSDAKTAKSAFIHRFPVIPISDNVGLLGWVEHANTINNTICTHRNTISKVRTHHETNVLRSYVEGIGSWEKLSMIRRTEVLDYVMSQKDCEAVDVARAMWHRSNTAEQWLERRTVFTQSLATMSMVGYVLGLGDRHLGNILLSMSTGKIVHIDFGDSFDVGRLRHVLPETVPFRLTRMLTNAMEVFGVDGVFRASCNRTQSTLHKNADSIMALLTAFVHDPIVQHKGKMRNMMEKSRTPQDIVERIRNKLRGTEMAVEDEDTVIFNTVLESSRRPDLLYMSHAFNDAAKRNMSKGRSTEEQVSMLIDEATRVENYAALYFGWGPLW
uniref:non-specific serine/threonine protein kinase n=1 Tax=Trypanosoma congolense (strain IL3000) TaxID=1068625 RepID=G0UIZ3_TRYCI|nr:putative phosphatidylinositol 3-kinase [Trypanosoma congolense IL3000]